MDYSTLHTQVLEFLSNGQLHITEQFGDPVGFCSTTYTTKQQSYGNILNVSVDPACATGFTIDSLINTLTTTTLILAEPGAACGSQNTYTATK